MSYHMLIRRGTTWSFRRSVPKALRAIVGQREIVRSLHTSDLREAKSWAITVAAEVVELPRFRGHPRVGAERSVHDAEEPSTIPARVSGAAR
jgi:Domain of unknown function (DUF6538)